MSLLCYVSLFVYNLNINIYLLFWLIIGPKHGLVHISYGMTLDFSYFGIKRQLSNFYCRKQIGLSMYLTLGVTLLASTTEIQLILYSQCTVVAPLWSSRDLIYLQINLVFLAALYMHIISP